MSGVVPFDYSLLYMQGGTDLSAAVVVALSSRTIGGNEIVALGFLMSEVEFRMYVFPSQGGSEGFWVGIPGLEGYGGKLRWWVYFLLCPHTLSSGLAYRGENWLPALMGGHHLLLFTQSVEH